MLRLRTTLVCALLTGTALGAAGAAGAQQTTTTTAPPPATTTAPAPTTTTTTTAPPPPRTIAAGVSAGGVDLSGLTAAAAATKLESILTPHLQRDLVFTSGGLKHRLKMSVAKLRFDAKKTAQAALAAPPAAAPAGGGAPVGSVVPLALTHSKLAVKAFVRGVAAQVYQAPRNATLRITLRHMILRRARHGRGLDTAAAAKLIDTTIDDGTASRAVGMPLGLVRPAVNANDLRSRYSTVITVDKHAFTLRLFKHLRMVKSYPVAVGQPAYPTPEGLFHIQDKQVNPVWSVPNSPWAGELAGTTVDGGSAANPLKARWMGITDGVGIHGTGEDYSIGSAASHGCIRMHVADVIALYPHVPVGTTVLIG